MIRKKMGSSVYLICGLIFTATGAMSLIASVLMALNLDYVKAHGQGDVEALPWIFGFTGAVALAAGIVLIVLHRGSEKKRKYLLEHGRRVMADITGFPLDPSVRVNGWPTYRIECAWTDPRTGETYAFRSQNLVFDPARYVTDKQVPVYMDPQSDGTDYYVDLSWIPPV